MLDVRRDGRSVIVAWEGALDEPAVGLILAALFPESAFPVVLDLSRASSICDSALARLAQSLRADQFRGLPEHQERLLRYLEKTGPLEATMDTSLLEEWGNVVQEKTDQFCRLFAEDRDFSGHFAAAIRRGALPQGVDPHDPRVVEIRRRCEEQALIDSEIPFTD